VTLTCCIHLLTRVTREHVNLRITEDLFMRLAALRIACSIVSLAFILRTYTIAST